MSYENVFIRFCMIAEISPQEGERYSTLCTDAIKYISVFVKEPTEESALLDNAAASCAYLCYALIKDATDATHFKSGDVSYTKCRRADGARELYNTALSQCGHLLKSGTFSFTGVSA